MVYIMEVFCKYHASPLLLDFIPESVDTSGRQISGDCPNCCEIIEVLDEDKVIGRTGGRCGKWEGRTEPREALKGTGQRDTVSGPSTDRKMEHQTCRQVDDIPDLIQIGVPKK